MSAQDNRAVVAEQCGRTVLWVGNETREWHTADWQACASFARSLGVDSICAKVADGNQRWYGSAEQLRQIRDSVLTRGAGFIPFLYCYGPKFGTEQIHIECATLADMLSVCPIVQADMEVEYNNQPAAAQLFCSLMRPVPGLLSISTWADPVEQQWVTVGAALAPATNQWVIQQYTTWLAGRESEYAPSVYTCIAPGVDLRPEFGADNVPAIVQAAIAHGHQTIYIWEYESAKTNPALVRQLVAEMAAVPKP